MVATAASAIASTTAARRPGAACTALSASKWPELRIHGLRPRPALRDLPSCTHNMNAPHPSPGVGSPTPRRGRTSKGIDGWARFRDRDDRAAIRGGEGTIRALAGKVCPPRPPWPSATCHAPSGVVGVAPRSLRGGGVAELHLAASRRPARRRTTCRSPSNVTPDIKPG